MDIMLVAPSPLSLVHTYTVLVCACWTSDYACACVFPLPYLYQVNLSLRLSLALFRATRSISLSHTRSCIGVPASGGPPALQPWQGRLIAWLGLTSGGRRRGMTPCPRPSESPLRSDISWRPESPLRSDRLHTHKLTSPKLPAVLSLLGFSKLFHSLAMHTQAAHTQSPRHCLRPALKVACSWLYRCQSAVATAPSQERFDSAGLPRRLREAMPDDSE